MNLLVAMFADTYARVFANAEREYGFKRFLSTHFYMHVTLPVPPPFNLLWSLWDMGFEILPQRILPKKFTYRRREIRKLRNHRNSRVFTNTTNLSEVRREAAHSSLRKQIKREQATITGMAEQVVEALPRQLSAMEERLTERTDLKIGQLRMLIEATAAKADIEPQAGPPVAKHKESGSRPAPVSGSRQVAASARPATRTNTAHGHDDEKVEFMSDRDAAAMEKERAPSQRGLLDTRLSRASRKTVHSLATHEEEVAAHDKEDAQALAEGLKHAQACKSVVTDVTTEIQSEAANLSA